MNITKNEKMILTAIAMNEMNEMNGTMPENCDKTTVWSDCIDVGEGSCHPEFPKGKSISAVVSSLCQKGLVSTGGSGRDSVVGLTEVGFDIWKASL